MIDLCDKVEKGISNIAKDMNLEIYDVIYLKEGGYNYLQIYIENLLKETTLDDCVEFSNAIDEIIDGITQDKHFLEVSSPGLEKKLRKVSHFEKVLNKEILVKLKSNLENKRRFEGILIDVNNENIKLIDNLTKKEIVIDYAKIKDANLIYKIPSGMEE